jgi:hypothetical protein
MRAGRTGAGAIDSRRGFLCGGRGRAVRARRHCVRRESESQLRLREEKAMEEAGLRVL